MLSKMKQMDAELEKKVTEMNRAQGNAKINAMAAVINELVKQREMLHQHMAAMQERMPSHMQSMLGGSESGKGAAGPSTESDSGRGKQKSQHQECTRTAPPVADDRVRLPGG